MITHIDLRDLRHAAVVSEPWLYLPSVCKQADLGWVFCFIYLSVIRFAPCCLQSGLFKKINGT